MNPFFPSDNIVALKGFVVVLATVLTGFGVTRFAKGFGARLLAWAILLTSTLSIEWLTRLEPPGFRMLAIIAALLLGMKTVVSVEDQASGRPILQPLSWFAFTCGWLGMRPAAFASFPGLQLSGAASLIWKGTKGLAVGTALMAIAYFAHDDSISMTIVRRLPSPHTMVIAALLLTGISFFVHFGVVNILCGLWRLAGADCRSLFRAPLKSKSHGEF